MTEYYPECEISIVGKQIVIDVKIMRRVDPESEAVEMSMFRHRYPLEVDNIAAANDVLKRVQEFAKADQKLLTSKNMAEKLENLKALLDGRTLSG